MKSLLNVIAIAVLLSSSVSSREVSASTDQAVITNSKELKNSIYTKLQLPGGSACVRLLTRNGAVGCSTPSTAVTVTGPLIAVSATTATNEIPAGSVAVISPEQAGNFLQRCSTDIELQNTLAGVLILHSPAFPGWNEAPTAPYPAYAVHETDRDYPWNPAGLDLGSKEFPFPIYQLDNETSVNAVQRVEYNRQIAAVDESGTSTDSTAVNVARMQLTMEGTTNSSTCINSQTCYPLGGYSIWAALPPLPPTPSTTTTETKQLPVVLVISQIDSTSLFHSLTQAADSPLSGLIAMMAAAQVLGSAENNNNENNIKDTAPLHRYQKRIVFLAVMGEPWDFMGSRRLLWELENGSLALQGLDIENIEAIIEIGQVGRVKRKIKIKNTGSLEEENTAGTATTTTTSTTFASEMNNRNGLLNRNNSIAAATTATSSSQYFYQLYGHVEKTGVSGTAAAPLLAFLQKSATDSTTTTSSDSPGVQLSTPSSTTPGLPPSTSSSFLHQLASIPVVVIQEFDAAFINQAYHSQYDTLNATDNIADDSVFSKEERFDQKGISATALFVAHALNSLAQSRTSIDTYSNSTSTSDTSIVPLSVNSTAVEETVSQLLDCLATRDPGMGCPLVSALMTPWSMGPAGHYVGILRTVSQNPSLPDPYVQTDVERFIWNFLAVSTATNITSPSPIPFPWCSPSNATTACPQGTICVGWRDIQGTAGSGRCLNSTTRLVPSYSTLLECVNCNGSATEDGTFRWVVNMTSTATAWAARYGWPEDPMWVESNWPAGTPFLELFLKESSAVEYVVLGAGLAVLVVSVIVVAAVQLAWNKRMKQD